MTRLMNTNPDADSTFIHVAPQKEPMEAVSTMVVTSSAVTTKTTTTTATTPFETRGISHSADMSQMVVLPEEVRSRHPGVEEVKTAGWEEGVHSRSWSSVGLFHDPISSNKDNDRCGRCFFADVQRRCSVGLEADL
jgi:hypothetical protein